VKIASKQHRANKQEEHVPFPFRGRPVGFGRIIRVQEAATRLCRTEWGSLGTGFAIISLFCLELLEPEKGDQEMKKLAALALCSVLALSVFGSTASAQRHYRGGRGWGGSYYRGGGYYHGGYYGRPYYYGSYYRPGYYNSYGWGGLNLGITLGTPSYYGTSYYYGTPYYSSPYYYDGYAYPYTVPYTIIP
jgi:hypothetical protein